MKKILIIGAIALVVIGCVLAAGCTSTTTPATTNEDFAVGTWTLPNGTTVIFGNDFKGIMITGDKKFNFTWKKNTDGKYQVDREDGAQVLWTLDSIKGNMTNAEGAVLTKQTSDISGAFVDGDFIEAKSVEITLDSNGGTSDGHIGFQYPQSFIPPSITPAKKIDSESGKEYICTGYYTEPEGGEMILYPNGEIVSTEALASIIEGHYYQKPTLYAHWVDSIQEPELIQLEP